MLKRTKISIENRVKILFFTSASKDERKLRSWWSVYGSRGMALTQISQELIGNAWLQAVRIRDLSVTEWERKKFGACFVFSWRNCRFKRRKPWLSGDNKRKRLNWALSHKHFTKEDCSDESNFEVGFINEFYNAIITIIAGLAFKLKFCKGLQCMPSLRFCL